jgi:hypothetical protein
MKAKAVSILITILLLSHSLVFAQAPSVCVISGVVYNPDGTLAAAATFRVSKITKNGVLISQGPFTYTADGSGAISFSIVRGATVFLYSTVAPFNVTGGVAVTVPNASSAALESLATVAAVPTAGLTVQTSTGPTTLNNKEGTLWFTSGLKATETAPGVAKIEIDTASSTIVPGTRTITTTNPLRIDGGASADFSANRVLSINGLAGLGTANQITGMNSGATAFEYKSLASGTSGSDFNIAHSANTITFHLPDASESNRGALTTGAQTIGGNKTFTAITKFGTGTNFTESGQANQGAASRIFFIADGSTGSPVSSDNPSVIWQRVDNTNNNTSVIDYQFEGYKKTGNGDHYVSHFFLRNESPDLRDGVAVGAYVYADPSSTPSGTQTLWPFWSKAERAKTGVRVSGIELGVVNSATTSLSSTVTFSNGGTSITANTGTPFAGLGVGDTVIASSTPVQYATLSAIADSTHATTNSVYTTSGGTTSTFQAAGSAVAISVGANAVYDDSSPNATFAGNIVSTGPGRNAFGLRFQKGTPSGPFIAGLTFGLNSIFSYGIDFNDMGAGIGATPARPIRFGNGQYTVWRNAANSADQRYLSLTSGNQWDVDPDQVGSIIHAYQSFGTNVTGAPSDTLGTGYRTILYDGGTGGRSGIGVEGGFVWFLAGGSAGHKFYVNSSTSPTLALTIASTAVATFASTVDATGYKVSGAATSGNVLRGNGTNFVSAQLAFTDLSGSLQAAQFPALTGDVTTSSFAATIANNAVTDAKLRQSAALSLIGRSANSTGNVADISAGADFNILRRSGTSIGFGSIDLSQSGAVGSTVLGVINGGSGVATTNAVHVFNSADEAITNNSETAVTFDSELHDSNSMHSTASNTDRLVAPIAGVYQICAAISWASNATGLRYAYFQLNGTTYTTLAKKDQNGGGGIDDYMSWCGQYSLAANDFVKLVVFQNSGGSLNLKSASAYSPRFSMTRISASN